MTRRQGGGSETGCLFRKEGEPSIAYGDGYSELYASTLVPKPTAVAAAREFFRTGRRPTTVEWEDL